VLGEPTVTRRKQAPIASITETQLSDDELNSATPDEGPARSTNPGESDDVSINSPSVINNQNLCLNVELVKRPQRPMSVGPGICVPTSIYLDDSTRTFSNPLSYLGGPYLPVTQRASKESVLSIDE